MHPASALRGTAGNELAGKTIALGVTGSIAAVDSVRIARELVRHGADVVAVLSGDGAAIVQPAALEYATGNPVVTHLTGQVEHVDLCGEQGRAALLLIAPATANTVSKIALGIDDTAVTSCASAALGAGLPILVAPAMHQAMERNPAVRGNLEWLAHVGVGVIPPVRAEGAAKVASAETIAAHVIRRLGPQTLKGRRVLVISGATAEAIDAMRRITNRSTGETGRAVAAEAWRLGAAVDLWTGVGHVTLPEHLPAAATFESVDDLARLAESMGSYDAVVVPAAVGDFTTTPAAGKIPSGRKASLPLVPTPKLLPILRRRTKGLLVAFKAEAGVDDKELEDRARGLLRATKADLVVGNELRSLAGRSAAAPAGAKGTRRTPAPAAAAAGAGRRVVLVTKEGSAGLTLETPALAVTLWDWVVGLLR